MRAREARLRRRGDRWPTIADGAPAMTGVPTIRTATCSWSSTAGRRSDRTSTASKAITALAAQGLAVGVHVVVSASRWVEIRPALKDHIGTRIELRLGDPADSEMDRRRARLLGQTARPAAASPATVSTW